MISTPTIKLPNPASAGSFRSLYDDGKLRLWLDISTHCNAKCPQCHRTNADGLAKVDWLPLISWSIEQFKAAFPPSTFEHIEEVQLCGTWGDPMMNKDVDQIVYYILESSNNLHVIINTNGSIRNEEWWWTLLEHAYSLYIQHRPGSKNAHIADHFIRQQVRTWLLNQLEETPNVDGPNS